MLALFASPAGRLAPRPFTLAVLLVYVLSFGSQLLLALPPSVALWSFALLQAALAWSWYALHAKRLRDAGQATGAAVGIAVIYVLAILLVLLVTAFVEGPMAGSAGASGDLLMIWFALAYVVGLFAEAADLGALGIILIVLAVIVLLPFVLAIGFSIWAATRPRAAAPL